MPMPAFRGETPSKDTVHPTEAPAETLHQDGVGSANDAAPQTVASTETPTEIKVAPAAFAVDTESRQLQVIGVHLIDANPLAPREVYTPAMILTRAEELRSQGQHDPIHVIPNPDALGRFIICDGWTRVLACVQHKVFDALFAEVHSELTIEESAWFGYEQNEGRQQHCDLDRALFYDKMIESGVPSAEIARRAGLSKSLMTFYRAFGALPEEILEIVRQQPEKFGATAAYQLRKLYEKCGLRRTLSLTVKFADENQTQRWLINQVQAAITPSVGNKTATTKHIRYANGYYKRTDNAFHVDIQVREDLQKAFEAKLEELLATVAIELAAKGSDSGGSNGAGADE